jgi:2-polyprenyl-6-methoxyphenol hydroxylase-like FAD-dependent oxidoreductase
LLQEFNYLLCVHDESGWKLDQAVTDTVSHEAMMADFEGPGVDERFRRLLAMAQPVRWGLFHHFKTSTYYRDRVALLGDSAHASLPFQAAGAAQGVEDALILSNVLAEVAKSSEQDANLEEHIILGLRAYDSIRRPRAQKQLEQSAEVARMIFFQHEEAGDDMNRILPRLQQGRFDWLWFHDVQEDVDKALSELQKAAREPKPTGSAI